MKHITLMLFAAGLAAAQTGSEQISAQGFGPVAVAGGERLELCLANMGEGTAKSTVQFFTIASGASVKAAAKHDSVLSSGQSGCYSYTGKGAVAQVFAVLAGDPNAGWDISDRNLLSSAQLLDAGGKARIMLNPLPKVVTTKLLQK